MARALFKSWFVDFDPVRAKAEGRDPSLPQPLADLFPDRFEDSELGEIPEGWEVGKLGDLPSHPRRGIQPNEIRYRRPVHRAREHMPKRCIALSKWGVADGLKATSSSSNAAKSLFGSFVLSFDKVGRGSSGWRLLDRHCRRGLSRGTRAFGFVLGHVSSTAFVEYTNAASTGTKMPRTSWGDMARYPLMYSAATGS